MRNGTASNRSGFRSGPRSGGTRRPRRWPFGNRAGQSLAVVAIAAVPLLGMVALCVDVGFLLTAREEAQRAADAAALAGAGAFFDYDPVLQPVEAEDTAEARAIDYATRNTIRNVSITAAEVTPEVLLDEQKVRVTIRREGLPTFFARVLGFDQIPVAAVAAAVLSTGTSTVAGPGQCVLPFAMPDLWDESTDGEPPDGPSDGEEWEFDPAEDQYYPYANPVPDEYGVLGYGDGFNGTGYGSIFRDQGSGLEDDYGRRIWVKVGPPGQTGKGSGEDEGEDSGGTDDMIGPGNFQLWAMPDPENCDELSNGAQAVEWNIRNCNPCEIPINSETGAYPVETETGNKQGAMDAIQDIINQDPLAQWENGEIQGSEYGDTHDEAVANSPRVRVVAMYSPEQIPDLKGKSDLQLNNFAKIFLEGGGEPTDFAVYARFLGPISGVGIDEEEDTGSLVQYLRLVE